MTGRAFRFANRATTAARRSSSASAGSRPAFLPSRYGGRKGGSSAMTMRRSYATKAESLAASSDMPWLITVVGVTVPGLIYILTPEKSHSSHETNTNPAHHDDHEGDKAQADSAPGEQAGGEEKSAPGGSGGGEKEEAGDGDSDKNTDPKAAHKSSQTGQAVPPPSADNRSTAEAWDEKKQGHEEVYKGAAIQEGQTKIASSSEAMPSKKAAGENPVNDPKRGEGEGVQKGGPR